MSELVNYTGNEISNGLEDLLTSVKNAITTYCPYVDDRVDLCTNGLAPTFGIRFGVVNGRTDINYIVRIPELEHGPITRVNVQAPDYAMMDHVITFDELSKIIDFVLEDHKAFECLAYRTYPGLMFPYQLHMNFDINWPDSEGPKIYCGEMNIQLEFQDPNLLKEFLGQIVEKYKDKVYTLILNNQVIRRDKKESDE